MVIDEWCSVNIQDFTPQLKYHSSRYAVNGEDGNEEGKAGRDNCSGRGRKEMEDEVRLADDARDQL